MVILGLCGCVVKDLVVGGFFDERRARVVSNKAEEMSFGSGVGRGVNADKSVRE